MKLAALLAGTALALVPTGSALAGETGNGQAHGNCRNSSAGGVHAPLLPEVGHGKGNGGLQAVGRSGCVVTKPVPPVVEPVAPQVEPEPVVDDRLDT
jgi:hypothetical protein